MERAAYFAGVKAPYIHRGMGNYWSVRFSMVPPGSKEYTLFWDRAQTHYAQALELERGRARKKLEKQIAEFIRNLHPVSPSLSQPAGSRSHLHSF
jgi:hypothetical protein